MHAAISNVGGRVTVEDLGSSNGTRIDGEIILGVRALRDGDTVTFGNVDARFEQGAGPRTTILPREAIQRHQTGRVTYDIDRQTGDHINNVGRDQYYSYVQQRESFLREVAASRTKARFVFWFGLFLTVGGVGGYGYFLLKALGDASTSFQSDAFASGTGPDDFPIFGPETSLGFPAGLLCFMVAFVGQILFFIGLIMWIVAAARARKVDSDPRHAWNSPFIR
ncbi:hypothetical protein Ntsu_23690 [Nocardia sp. IFM 10818]